MDSKNLNEVQIIMLVGRLLSEQKFDELADMARRDTRVFNQLVETMRSGRVPFYLFAATSLTKAGTAALQPFMEALEDAQYPVRQIAAMGLGELGDERAIDKLVALLSDAQEVVRQVAAIALGKIGAGACVEPLLQATGDESELVRRAVVNALGMIGDEVAIPTLQWLIKEDTEPVAEQSRKAIQRILNANG